MDIALLIVNVVTAILFIAAGAMKALRPKAALAANGLAWVEGYSPSAVKAIGLAEVLGGLGLVLPVLTGIAPVLAPVAAVLLAVLMVGAIVVHRRRREPFVPALVLGVLALASAALGVAAL